MHKIQPGGPKGFLINARFHRAVRCQKRGGRKARSLDAGRGFAGNMQNGNGYGCRHLVVKIMGRVTSHHQQLRPRRFQPLGTANQGGNRAFASAENGGGPIRYGRIAVHNGMDMILVAGGVRKAHQLFKQIRRGQRSHAAYDADGFHAAVCLPFFNVERFYPLFYHKGTASPIRLGQILFFFFIC
ncbi:hypothetical protein SDC9_166634 [bioreactor metagenome]|uniref:Uncharacterized protein n=1 Tax=bioreactor metagenome TaxID=1076179 RepID=A0A645FXL4_9ZZZZ